MADTQNFNPFGLIGTQELEQERVARRQQESNIRRAQLSGIDFASAELGNAIGRGLRQAAGKAGLIRDKEAEDAAAVDAATKRAEAAFQAIPQELRDTSDPFGNSIQRRQELIKELDAVGMTPQADKVRQQVIDLHDQRNKFLKAEGEREKLDLDIETSREELKRTQQGLRERDEIVRLQNSLDLLDPTDPIQAARMDQISDRIEKLSTITGTTEFDPDASDKITVRKVEQSLFEGQRSLDGFLLARDEFAPEFLQLPTQIKNFAVKMADIAGLPLPEEAKAGLRDFTAFKQRTSANLNAYIKFITGAQMSNPEAIRLRKDVPTDDDSPEEYQTKLNKTISTLSAANARALSALQHTDDRKKFIEVMVSPLSEWVTEGENTSQESADNAVRQEALQALRRLEQLQAGPQ